MKIPILESLYTDNEILIALAFNSSKNTIMKKIIFTLLVLSLFGCEKDDNEPILPVKKSKLFRLEFHADDTVKLTHNYIVDTHPVIQKSPVGDTVKVYEFNATEGQRVDASIQNFGNKYRNSIIAIWGSDTIFNKRLTSQVVMGVTL